jgi:hypothetical protein
MAFAPLPPVPQAGLPEWQFSFLNNVKQNIEELTGQKGDTGYQSLVKGAITVEPAGELAMRQVTAIGAGFGITTTSGTQNVASLEDHAVLITDVQTLINDVAYLRIVLNALINQIQNA